MAKKKGKVRIITLECTEARKAGVPPSRYTTKKNTQTHPERLEKEVQPKYAQTHGPQRDQVGLPRQSNSSITASVSLTGALCI